MNVSRYFLLIGSLYLLIGIGIGMYMGAAQDHRLVPAHAHINLLGFTLMAVFGLAYRVFPALDGTALARAHFWLHRVGALVLLVMLFLLFSENITEASMAPLAPIAELLILLGTATFVWNVLRNAT